MDPSPSPPPSLRLLLGMHGNGLWGAVGYKHTECAGCTEQELWSVGGAVYIWSSLQPLWAAFLQGSCAMDT